jgi:hypothetical protein
VYSITYRNKLKQGKELKDFQKWLKASWIMQKSWGAETVHVWSDEEGDRDFVFCEYRVQDIRQWNHQNMLHAGSDAIRELDQIVETSRMTVSRIEYDPEPLSHN